MISVDGQTRPDSGEAPRIPPTVLDYLTGPPPSPVQTERLIRELARRTEDGRMRKSC